MQTKEEMFFHAATQGNLPLIKELILEDGINPDIESGKALCLSAQAGHIHIMDFLLIHGASITIHSNLCDPALTWAAAADKIESVKFLLGRGANPRANNASALCMSIMNKHNAIALYLLSQAIFTENQLNWALRYATEKDSLEVVRELIQQGAKVFPGTRKAASTYRASKVLSFFEESIDNPGKNEAHKSTIVRSKRAEWSILYNNDRCTRSLGEFLDRLEGIEPDSFQIYFDKKNPKDTKISTLIIDIKKKSKAEYLTRLELVSNRENEEIHNNFKKFGLDNKFLIDYKIYGNDKIITLTTANFSNTAELEPYIQLCNEFDPTIPIEILDELKMACHISLIPSKEKFEKIINKNGFKHALTLANSCSNKELFILSLADTLFENHFYGNAASCYRLITAQDKNLYKKAQYQLGCMIFNFTESADYSSPRDHARAALFYLAEAMDYLDSSDLSRRLFNCLCTGSYNMNDCPLPFPTGASVDAIFSLGDFIYSVHTKAKIKKSTYGVNFFDQSAHIIAVNKARKSIIKQSQVEHNLEEIVRCKRAGWYIATPNKTHVRSIAEFLVRLESNGPDNFQIYFDKKNPKDTKISTLTIIIKKKSKTEYLTRLELASNSKNEEIYNSFKKLGLDHQLSIFGDYGKDNIISLTTADFSNPAELEPYIQLCNEFDPTIPIEILDELKMACHISLIPSKEEFEKIIHKNGFEHALKLASACSNRELFIITLADTLFNNHSYKDAAICYQLITKEDRSLYKKAQYQLGCMIFKYTEFADYDSLRNRACASLPYFIKAMDYLDSSDLLRQVFNCLCTGVYTMNDCPAPFPTGASLSSIVLLGDYIYSVQKKSNTIYEETELETPSSSICLGK